jgi:hypothetical protein
MGRRYSLRALAPSNGEIADFYTTADLGLSARGSLFGERLTLSIAATNGEGRIDREANPAKNLTVVATGTPLQLDVHRGPLSIRLHAAFRRGTLGEDNVPNHRYSAAVSFVGPCPSAGFEVHLADGRDGNDEKSLGYGVWANSWLATHWIGVAARYDSLDDGTEEFEHDGLAQRATVAVFSDLFDERGATDRRRMRLYLAYQRDWYGEDADALRGASQARDVDRVMFTLEARGSWSN